MGKLCDKAINREILKKLEKFYTEICFGNNQNAMNYLKNYLDFFIESKEIESRIIKQISEYNLNNLYFEIY